MITGGANGIGRETALMLNERHDVKVFDSDSDGLESLPNSITSYVGDVSDSERVKEVVEQEEFDVLVNCAGYYEQGALEDVGEETARKIYDTNVFGPLNFIRESTSMLREKEGRIINVSSVAGRISLPFFGIYSSTKHALEALSDAQRMELEETGVDVVIVEPAAVDTGFNRRAVEALDRYVPGSFYSEIYDEKMDKELNGMNVEKAAKKVVKAVEAESPSARYRIGWEAWVGPFLKSILPVSLSDRILGRH